MEKSNIPNILSYGIRVINIVFAPSAVPVPKAQKYTEYRNVSFTLILVE